MGEVDPRECGLDSRLLGVPYAIAADLKAGESAIAIDAEITDPDTPVDQIKLTVEACLAVKRVKLEPWPSVTVLDWGILAPPVRTACSESTQRGRIWVKYREELTSVTSAA